MHFEENVPLAPLTTLRIGGAARFFFRAHSEADLLAAVEQARSRQLPVFFLGGGSNLVVPDSGFRGLVIQVALRGPLQAEASPEDDRAVRYTVPAGEGWEAFVDFACAAGLAGVECLAGIPGLVGGSPIQNIGAYGQEVSQTVFAVRVLDLETLQFTVLSREQCAFAYRTSVFNSTGRGRYVVTRVTFRFDRDAKPVLNYPELRQHFAGSHSPTPSQVAATVRTIRGAKGMYLDPTNPSPDHRSAGSFFKNPIVPLATLDHIAQTLGIPAATVPHWPVPSQRDSSGNIKLSAAWLIERAGFPKGFVPTPESPVGISSRHTLALINRTGFATCADLLGLRDRIIRTVSDRFGVTLEQEPVMLA